MKKFFSLRTLILLALLAALCAVLKAYASVPLSFTGIKTAEMTLSPIPVIIAGVFFGPVAGGLVGFAGEMAGFFMGIKMGGYDPVFSVVMGLYGVIAGLFYINIKADSFRRISFLTASGIICTAFIKTIYLIGIYNLPAGAIIPSQAVTAGVEIPVFILIITALLKSLRPIVNKSFLPHRNSDTK